jgi:hypothetical protein
MKLLKEVQTPLSEEKAEKIAAKLNADPEDTWTYKTTRSLCADDIIRSFVQAFDEDGKFAGTL